MVVLVAVVVAGCTSAPTATPPTTTSNAAAPSTRSARSSPTTRPRATPTTRSTEQSGAFEDDGVPGLGSVEVDVDHYDLDLDYDPSSQRLRSQTTLTLTAHRELSEIRLDYRGPDVSEVTVDDRAATSEREDKSIVIRPPLPVKDGQQAKVVVKYDGTPSAKATAVLGGGVLVGWHSEPDGSYVLSEPDGASTWYPNNNHPRDKATYDIRVTVPKGYTAIANGVLEDQNDSGSGTTFHWAMHDPMASYLTTVVTGRFNAIDQRSSAGVPLRNYVPDGDPTPDPFADQAEDMQILVDRIGPYPFDEYGAVQLPESFFGNGRSDEFLSGAAFEAQGRSLFGSRSTISSSVVHELAHQWMGDNVTVSDWSKDIWWVEGFAHYAEWVRDEAREGPEAYDAQVEEARSSLRKPRGIGHRPTGDMFDQTTYVGGALVFADLRAEVGDETFWKILRTFNERYRHANASTDDLIAVANEVSGKNLDRFFANHLA